MNEEEKKIKIEKKGSNILIIVALVIALLAVSGYVVYDKFISKKETEENKEVEKDKGPVIRSLDVDGKEVADLLYKVTSPYNYYGKPYRREWTYYYSTVDKIKAEDLEDYFKIDLAFKETNLNCDTKEFGPEDIESHMKAVLGNDITYKKVGFYCWPKSDTWYTMEEEMPSEFVYDETKDLWIRKEVEGFGDVGAPFNSKIVKAIVIDEKTIEIYDKYLYAKHEGFSPSCATGGSFSYKVIEDCDVDKITDDDYFNSFIDQLSSIKYTFKLNEETNVYYFVSIEIISE